MIKRKTIFICFCITFIIGIIIPQNLKMPVKGATKSDYNAKSFWYQPWGKSITHKGVDVFAKKGTAIHSSTKGLVLFAGEISLGGKFILILGPKWRIHYYAHLNSIDISNFSYVNHQTKIGTVGTSGNAKGKQPHLHYSITSLIPYVWKIDSDKQGWKKMFYLNPIPYLKSER